MRRRTQLASALAALGGLAVGYTLFVRPRMNRWGATRHEAERFFPGDSLADADAVTVTHALDVRADVEEVWPWLLQIGQGRGGFYSYAFLENLVGSNIKNVKEIVPSLQALKEGDVISIHPSAPSLKVVHLDDPQDLVLQGGREHDAHAASLYDNMVWSFHLRPHGRGSSRLIARIRATWPSRLPDKLTTLLFMEPAHFVMERKMMLTIKALAERAQR